MKNHRLLWSAFFALMGISIQAQDDLYYNPVTDAPPPRTVAVQPPAEEYEYREEAPPETDYYENDYAYEYSSRIRRFHRPPMVIDYYDPLFVDQYFYDPFYLPGASIYTYGGFYNNPWAWNPYVRYPFWGPPRPAWGWGPTFGVSINIGWGWSPWNNWNVYNNYYYDPYWAWNGYNPYYCPGNVWVNNYYIYNNGYYGNPGYAPQTYLYGPRSGGVKTSNNSYTALSTNGKRGRLVDTKTEGPVVELNNPQTGGIQKSRMSSSELPNTQPTQQAGKPARTTPTELQREQPSEQTSKPSRTAPTNLETAQPAEQVIRSARTTPTEFQGDQPTEQTSKPSRTAPSSTTRTEPAEQSTRQAPSGAQPQRTQPGKEVSPTRRQQPAAQERSEGSRPSGTSDRPNRSKSDPRSYQPTNRGSEPSRSYDRPSSSNRSSSPSSGSSSRSGGGSKPSSGGSSGKSSGGGGSKGRN